jgi:hypothetical protein
MLIAEVISILRADSTKIDPMARLAQIIGHWANNSMANLSSISALSALTGPLTSILVSLPLIRNCQLPEPGFRLKVRHA